MSYAPRVIVAPVVEPLTVAEGKLRAGLDWPDGDPRDVLMAGFIAAARGMVERRTEFALLTQTRDVFVNVPTTLGFSLPRAAWPLQAVAGITRIDDTVGAAVPIDPTGYSADLTRGRVTLAAGSTWPTEAWPCQLWVVRVVVGWPSPAALLAEAPLLVHAVGLLTAHYATLGRDLASTDAATEVPLGFEDAIGSYVPVVLA